MVEGLKFVRRICATPPMRDYVAGEFMPGERVRTDELAGVLRDGRDGFHPTSTCSMGALVDEKRSDRPSCVARGGASVIPAVPSGNINAAVIAVAEKAADLIGAE